MADGWRQCSQERRGVNQIKLLPELSFLVALEGEEEEEEKEEEVQDEEEGERGREGGGGGGGRRPPLLDGSQL